MSKWLASVALTGALMVPVFVRAEEQAPAVNSGNLSVSGGVDYVTQYYFRGQLSSPSGVILQPYGQLNVAAYKGDTFSITPYIGTWNDVQDTSIHNDTPGTPAGKWWESDVYGGVTWGLPANFKLDTLYTFYTSPSDAFKTVGEFGVKLAYDDSAIMKDKVPFTIQPYVAYYVQTFNDSGSDVAQYAEIGLTPTVPLGNTKLIATFPLACGFSPDGTYFNSDGTNASFGYWSAGAFLSYPLPIGAKWGAWTITGGATYVKSDAFSAKFAAYDGTTKNNDAVVGKVSLTFAY